MIEIIGIVLMMLGIAVFAGFIAYVIGDFESIKEAWIYDGNSRPHNCPLIEWECDTK